MPKNLVNEKEDKALSFDNLRTMLGPDATSCNFFLYETLRTITPAQFFSKPAAIILMENKRSGDKVGHFMAIIQQRNHIEHFDSYGYSIQDELNITGEPPYIIELLNETSRKVIESKVRFQSTQNDSETCGRWCVARVRMRDLFISEFKDFFERPVVTKDQKVVLLTYFLG